MIATKDKLAKALVEAGLERMAIMAEAGFYDDFLSPIAFPITQLLADLRTANTPASYALAARVRDGEFDATKEEADAWANKPEIKRVIEYLSDKPKRPPDL
jgi:hypothetical protein